MKLFEITFSFLDPTKAVGTFAAESEEEAINNLKAQLESQVERLEIEAVEEVEFPTITPAETEEAVSKVLN